MQIAVCMTGVNDKESPVIEQLHQKLPEANFYFHTFTNKTHLIPSNFHDRLFTMHYPKWHYHPMQANAIAKHGKFAKYKDKRIMWDELYFGIVPIIEYSDLLKKIPIRFDLIIRLDYNTQIDRQVDLNHWLRKAYEKGPVGFMTRPNRGPEFGTGRLAEVPANSDNKEDDWFGFLPSSVIIHHRKHFDHAMVRKLVKNEALLPAQWGWYQILSEPYGDIHSSVHGFAQDIK